MKKVLLMAAGLLCMTSCSPKTEVGEEPNTAAKVNEATAADSTDNKDNDAKAEKADSATNSAVAAPDVSGQQKVLVAYFSATGTTAGVAKIIGEVSGGTLFEIVPETKYTDADLDWRNEQSRSSVEMKDAASRPAMVGKVENIGDYQTIYLGYPIWWNVAPHVVNTFLESHDLSGKTVIPFCTAGSSSIDNSVVELRKALPNAKVLDGKKWLASSSKEEIAAWIDGLK